MKINIVSYKPQYEDSPTNIIMIDGKPVNGTVREDAFSMTIGMYASCDDRDYYGNLLRDNSESRKQFGIVKEWVITNPNFELVEEKSGWSTKTQYWREWIIRKLV